MFHTLLAVLSSRLQSSKFGQVHMGVQTALTCSLGTNGWLSLLTHPAHPEATRKMHANCTRLQLGHKLLGEGAADLLPRHPQLRGVHLNGVELRAERMGGMFSGKTGKAVNSARYASMGWNCRQKAGTRGELISTWDRT